jgi:hypothetical protein
MAKREQQLWVTGTSGPPVLCAEGGWISIYMFKQFSHCYIHSTPPSSQRQIKAGSLCTTYAHIHSKAGATSGVRWLGRNGSVPCAKEGVVDSMKNSLILATFVTPALPLVLKGVQLRVHRCFPGITVRRLQRLRAGLWTRQMQAE